MVPVPFRFESRFGDEFSGFSHGRPHVIVLPLVSWYDGTDGFCLLLVASRETTLSRVVIRKGFRKPQVVGSIPIAGSTKSDGYRVRRIGMECRVRQGCRDNLVSALIQLSCPL